MWWMKPRLSAELSSLTNGKSPKSFLCAWIWGTMAFFFPVKDDVCRGDHLSRCGEEWFTQVSE